MTQQTIQVFFPFSPQYMSWDDWNGNLAVSYGELNIPFTSEDDWKITANIICSNTAFASYPIPNPDTCEDWQDWASQFAQAINGPSY